MAKRSAAAAIAPKLAKYALAVSLVGLLVFTIVYVARIARRAEGFTQGERFRLVYMYSNTCPYCVQFTPTFDKFQASQAMNSNIDVLKVEKSDQRATQYMEYVSGYPTVLVFGPDGKLIKSQVGKVTLEELQAFVREATSSSS